MANCHQFMESKTPHTSQTVITVVSILYTRELYFLAKLLNLMCIHVNYK